VAATLHSERDRGGGGEEPAATEESEADGGRDRRTGGRTPAAATGLGSAEVAGAAGAGRDHAADHHGASNIAATRFGAAGGSVSCGGRALRARHAESVVADGFQKPAGMGSAGGAVVGAGRSQSLRDRAAGNMDDTSGACKTGANRSV